MSSETWTIRKVLTWTTQHFEKRGVDAPRLTTEVLLAHALKTSRVRLYVDLDRPLEKTDQCCGFGGTFAVKYPASCNRSLSSLTPAGSL